MSNNGAAKRIRFATVIRCTPWCSLLTVDGYCQLSLRRENVVSQICHPLSALIHVPHFDVREGENNPGRRSLDWAYDPTFIRSQVSYPTRSLKVAQQTSVNRDPWLARSEE